MISIKKRIMEALTPLGVPVEFLTRESDGTFPFIVFNVTETPVDFADDEEVATLYLVSVNIFSLPEYNFEALKLQIIESMKNAGFKKQLIPPCEFIEKEKVYNQPMAFTYYEYIGEI